jgi:RNA polymerase sigma-70 factor (ECF subfamily)
MSKRVSKAASQELAFLAALESIHADVDISKIAEIQDWSRAVRGKLYGASIKGTSHIPDPQASLPPAIVTNAPSSRVVPAASGNLASHGSVQYSEMAIPQLIAVCTSESTEESWIEFIRRFRPLIARVIARVAHRFGKDSNALIEDLVQEVFVKLCHDDYRALKGVATMRDERSWFSFLKVVAANVANDHFRRVALFRAGAPQGQESIEALPEVDKRKASSVIERRVLLEQIDRVLKTLSNEPNFERDRAIFWLHYSQGFTAKEIAALPGVTLNARGVESALLRLTRQIRSALA